VRASGAEVTISESTISGNTATGNGGGILMSGGELTLQDSTVSGNGSGNAGGGLSLTGPSPMQITRSTISGNTAVLGGGITTSNDVTVSYSTISGNSAGLRGGGVAVGDNEVLALMFSTLNNNSAGSGGSNLYARLTGGTQITSALIVNGQGSANCDTDTLPTVLAPSLSDDASCIGFTEDASAGSRLGVLTDNGGPTLTHALFQGNPAIDGAAMSCASTDQRGFTKPVDGDNDGSAHCDIGAVEFIDSDFDGVIDFYESNNGLDPNNALDPNGGGDDLDGDGVTNRDEFEGNLEADNPDTDGDILGDGIDNDPLNASNACVQDGLGDAEFDMTAMTGLVTQCAAESSITVRAIAIIENGAELELYSPNVRFDSGVSAPVGAQVEVNAVNPMLAP
jgi:parallel beta-helix repeat protein